MATNTKTEKKHAILVEQIALGSDPELFFKKDGKIIGSEKVIPAEGISWREVKTGWGEHQRMEKVSIHGKIIRDGIQAELNPNPEYCRQMFAGNIARLLHSLEELLPKGVTIDLSPTVTITQEEMDSLTPASKQFGCTPSKNIWNDSAKLEVTDASKYLFRSAGGHVHIGKKFKEGDQERAVRMLDILVGNTCVLMDRDPGQVERRKNYGRAGEYRLPPHGLEYRTLSNFWLRAYPLMSFVMGMSRFAVSILNYPELEYEILNSTNSDKIQKAINENDFDLAYQNFSGIEDILASIGVETGSNYGTVLNEENLEFFHHFISRGIDHWFGGREYNWGAGNWGWENFLATNVMQDLARSSGKQKPSLFTTA